MCLDSVPFPPRITSPNLVMSAIRLSPFATHDLERQNQNKQINNPNNTDITGWISFWGWEPALGILPGTVSYQTTKILCQP